MQMLPGPSRECTLSGRSVELFKSEQKQVPVSGALGTSGGRTSILLYFVYKLSFMGSSWLGRFSHRGLKELGMTMVQNNLFA